VGVKVGDGEGVNVSVGSSVSVGVNVEVAMKVWVAVLVADGIGSGVFEALKVAVMIRISGAGQSH